MLVGSSGNADLETDCIVRLERNRLNARNIADGSKTSRSIVSDLAEQLAREVAGAIKIVLGILVRDASFGSRSLVDCLKSVDDLAGGISTLGDKVRQQLGLVAKQINTISGVEETKSQITNKVVLNKVPLGDNISAVRQNRLGRESVSVGRVEGQIGGPCVHVHVVLDIGGVNVVDIKRITLKLEDVKHIRQLHVVVSNAANIDSRGGGGGKLTRNTEGEGLVKTSKDEVDGHYILVIILTNIFLCKCFIKYSMIT